MDGQARRSSREEMVVLCDRRQVRDGDVEPEEHAQSDGQPGPAGWGAIRRGGGEDVNHCETLDQYRPRSTGKTCRGMADLQFNNAVGKNSASVG